MRTEKKKYTTHRRDINVLFANHKEGSFVLLVTLVRYKASGQLSAAIVDLAAVAAITCDFFNSV